MNPISLSSVCKKLALGMAALLFLAAAPRSEAAFRTSISGVTVSYSGAGLAYYNPDDETVTIEILSGGGNLNVSVKSDAPLYWGTGVDILILAGDHNLRSINIRGRHDCIAYVAGEVNYVTKFALNNGVVGNTIFYGRDYGLAMNSDLIPPVISMRYSYATAQLFGYPHESVLSRKDSTAPTPSTPDGARVRLPREPKPVQ